MFTGVFVVVFMLLGSFGRVTSHCTCGGKSTCITEELLKMLMSANRHNCHGYRRPAFLAFMKKSENPVSNNVVFKFDDVETNIGNNYNPASGVFTAPQKGLYAMSCTIMSYGYPSVTYEWRKNGARFARGYANKQHNSLTAQSMVLELRKGDRVHIQHVTNRKEKVYGIRYSYFSGYLL